MKKANQKLRKRERSQSNDRDELSMPTGKQKKVSKEAEIIASKKKGVKGKNNNKNVNNASAIATRSKAKLNELPVEVISNKAATAKMKLNTKATIAGQEGSTPTKSRRLQSVVVQPNRLLANDVEVQVEADKNNEFEDIPPDPNSTDDEELDYDESGLVEEFEEEFEQEHVGLSNSFDVDSEVNFRNHYQEEVAKTNHSPNRPNSARA